MTSRTVAASFAFALAALGPRLALAADGPAPVPDRASQLYKKARALEEDAKWAEAEALYQQAWDLRRSYDIAGNLGDCETHVGQLREAAEHLTFAIENYPAGADPHPRAQLQKVLDETLAKIGTVRVTLKVEGAQILVDGRPAESFLHHTIFVDPGTHRIDARLAGYTSVAVEVTVAAGSSRDVRVTLTPNGGAPASGRSSWPIGVGIGAAAVGVGLGIAGLAASGSNQSDVNSLTAELQPMGGGACLRTPAPAQCSQLSSAYVNVGSFRSLGIVGFAVAGVATVATVTYVLVAPSGAASTGSTVKTSVGIGPGRGDLLIGGTF
jgi:hypothetical protein